MAKHKIQNSILLATAMGVTLLLTKSHGIFSEEAPKDNSAICRECHLLDREPVGFPEDKIPEQMRKSPEEPKKPPQRKFWHKTKHSQAGNICTNCHDPYTLKESRFLIESREELCLSCHTIQREKVGLEYPHPQAKLGQCIMCHNPHGSAFEHQVRYKVNLLCTFCHQTEKELLALDYSHRTVEEENCVYCHEPHGSTVEYRLRKTADELCLGCHKEKEEDLQRAQVHNLLLTGQCIACHNPHGADNKNRLIAQGRELCLRCHWEQAGEFSKIHLDSAAELKDDCLTCHTAHCSGFKGVVISEKSKLCYSCHQEAFGQFAQIYHHPIEADEDIVSCTSCHNPHGTEEGRRLLKEGNELCFNCHPEVEGTYLNSAHDDDDMFCTACHQPHGSSNEKRLILAQTHLCYLCHEEIRTEFDKSSHHPITASPGYLECNNCHNPHMDTTTQKIVDPDDTSTLYGSLDSAFCLRCHDGGLPSSVAGGSPVDKSVYTSSAHYVAGSKDCDDCHHHHGTDNADMLTSSETEEAFCYSSSDSSCHGTGDSGNDVATDFAKTYNHDVENSGDIECNNCHNIHLDTATQKIIDPDDTATLYGALDLNFCLRCHDGSPPSSVGGIPVDQSGYIDTAHYTAGSKDCDDCHHQHGSNNAGMLIGSETDEAYCYNAADSTCHGVGDSGNDVATAFAKTYHHDVENSGDVECANCHNSHLATATQKIIDPDDTTTLYGTLDTAFCLRCHDGDPPTSVGGIPVDESGFVNSAHATVSGSECHTCHHQHGTDNYGMVISTETEQEFCYSAADGSCHGTGDSGTVVQTDFDEDHHHDVENSGDIECSNCHNWHIVTTTDKVVDPYNVGTLYETLDSDFCLSCHNGSVPDSVGGIATDVSDFTGDTHAGQGYLCTECHEQHGSAVANMLTSPIQTEGVIDTESACLACHDADGPAVLNDDIESLFTVGVAHKDEGYTCSTCHDAHGSGNYKNTLESGKDLCYNSTGSCHGTGETKPIQPDFASAEELDRHNVPEDDVRCYHCHNAHLNDDDAGEKIVNPDARTTVVAVTSAFCLSCHDDDEPDDPPGIGDTPQTSGSSFFAGASDEHVDHIALGLLCTDCHVAKHSSTGPAGVDRSRHLRSDITVVEFAYKNKNSCLTPGRSPDPCH